MSWERIQGHEARIRAFAHVVAKNRLAHAYLFVGPEGVGKRHFAHEFAKTMLCDDFANTSQDSEDPKKFAACGHCESCLIFDAGTHPDFFTLARPEDKNEIPIKEMQEFCQGFSLKSARGRGKFAVLDDADDLNDESANCFLKTLEEPPPRSVFILIGTSADRQLPTILSRCQMVRFAPLPEKLVQDLLRRQGIDETILERASRTAGGSPGRAMALADPELWKFRQTLLNGLIRPGADTVALAKAWTQFSEEAGKETSLHRRRAALVLGLWIEFLTDALAVGVGSDPANNVKIGTEDRAMLHKWIERAGPEKTLQLLERALEAETQLDRYVQVSLVLEALLDNFGTVIGV